MSNTTKLLLENERLTHRLRKLIEQDPAAEASLPTLRRTSGVVLQMMGNMIDALAELGEADLAKELRTDFSALLEGSRKATGNVDELSEWVDAKLLPALMKMMQEVAVVVQRESSEEGPLAWLSFGA